MRQVAQERLQEPAFQRRYEPLGERYPAALPELLPEQTKSEKVGRERWEGEGGALPHQ
jgi:hypothetical protein